MRKKKEKRRSLKHGRKTHTIPASQNRRRPQLQLQQQQQQQEQQQQGNIIMVLLPPRPNHKQQLSLAVLLLLVLAPAVVVGAVATTTTTSLLLDDDYDTTTTTTTNDSRGGAPRPVKNHPPLRAASPSSTSRHLQNPYRVHLEVPECQFQVTQKCTVRDGDNNNNNNNADSDLPAEGVDCETFTPPMLVVDSCMATPYQTTLLYNGGSCAQTDNADVLGIVCQDGGGSGESSLSSQFETNAVQPPLEEGEESYIIVTDAFNLGIVYHTGLVAVGSQYTLESTTDHQQQQQQLMEYGFMIRIFDKNDPSLLLQQVVYDQPLCSSALEAANRFGASQIVQYTNVPQGRVALFKSYQVDMELAVQFALTGRLQTAAVDSLTFMTNFAGYIDLTDTVRGKMIEPSQPLKVTLDVNVDLYEKRRNTLLTQISVGGNYCVGTDFLAFTTGGSAQARRRRRQQQRR